MRITQYADQLLEDLKKLQGCWPDKIIKMQENWIGRSQGAYIKFAVVLDKPIKSIGVYEVRVALHPELDVDELQRGDIAALVDSAGQFLPRRRYCISKRLSHAPGAADNPDSCHCRPHSWHASWAT